MPPLFSWRRGTHDPGYVLVVVKRCHAGLTLSLALAFPAAQAASEDAVDDRVWAAVDAPDADYPAAFERLAKTPRATWRSVYAILKAGRAYDPEVPQEEPITEEELLQKRFLAAKWQSGKLRIHNLGDEPEYWYSFRLPKSYDGLNALPVYVNLGGLALGGRHAPPDGWATVDINWAMLTQAATLEPMSLVTGTGFQSYLFSVLADLERRFRVDRDRVFLGGDGRGANGVWYQAMSWPDIWAGAIAVNGHYKILPELHGNLDGDRVLAAFSMKANRAAAAYNQSLGKRIGATLVDFGAATGAAFEKTVWEWMKSRARNPFPKEVRYTLFDPTLRGAYWIEIREVKRTGGRRELGIAGLDGRIEERFYIHKKLARVEAEITAPNRIAVRANNAKSFLVFLSPEQFDFANPVRVRAGGKTFEEQPSPSLATLMRNYRRHRDNRRLYPAEMLVEP